MKILSRFKKKILRYSGEISALGIKHLKAVQIPNTGENKLLMGENAPKKPTVLQMSNSLRTFL